MRATGNRTVCVPVRRLSSRYRHGDVRLSGSRVSTRSLSNCEELVERLEKERVKWEKKSGSQESNMSKQLQG